MTSHIVHGVTWGEYSDYRVVAIFSTREKAVEYIREDIKRSNKNPHIYKCIRCKGDKPDCSECLGTGVSTNLEIEEFDFDPE